MDLGTIKSKLNGGMYSSSQQCIDDFELMFNNCFDYNRGKNEVVQLVTQPDYPLLNFIDIAF